MRIQQLSQKLGLSARSIRFYEAKGLLPPARRLENGYRVFGPEDEKRLKRIAALREIGLTLEEIGALPSAEGSAETDEAIRKALERRRSELFAQKNQLERDLETVGRMISRSESNAAPDAASVEEDAWFVMAAELKRIRELHAGWTDVWDFDAQAALHDERVLGGASPAHPYYAQALEAVRELIRPHQGESGLDIGTGTGNLAGLLIREGAIMSAAEQSSAMLEICRAKLPQLDARTGNFLYLPFDRGSFDFAVSSYAFHHLNDEQKPLALREIRRVLKPGGRFGLVDTMFTDSAHRERRIRELEQAERSNARSEEPPLSARSEAGELFQIRNSYEAHLDELLALLDSEGWQTQYSRVSGRVYALLIST
ncbi:MerR family transcriptional regulator [Saccharibacillus qingshengii]|uniref:MerR family transcriptional regulator n=1 Tax=Saccharibacillus qingshengii TaxID=1763540 RepID=UPI001552AE25|nr:MerR family transcriptional regulator [Saccharibacillus qingshengii]